MLLRARDSAVHDVAGRKQRVEEAEERKTDTEESGVRQSTTPWALREEAVQADDGSALDRVMEAEESGVEVVESVASAAARDPLVVAQPRALMKKQSLVSGGVSIAAKRRQRRVEAEQAAARRMLIKELREEYAERAKVLRQKVKQVIAELREVTDILENRRGRRDAQLAAELVRREERQRPLPSANGLTGAMPEERSQPAAAEVITPEPQPQPEVVDDELWTVLQQQYEATVPKILDERGTLKEMRAERRRALKEAKHYRAARRVRRMQKRKELFDRLHAAGVDVGAAHSRRRSHKPRPVYHYEQQGNYGDVELRDVGDGKTERVAQLRTTNASNPSCLPTALLVFTKNHTQEVRLDTCAQYSVAGIELRRYGRCISRKAPVDIVEGFGGGVSRVLGVWRFTGTTQYQQRITVDALLVDGQGDELLVGEDWMIERQVKIDFGTRELKYRDSDGRKVILPFTCHGVSTLPQPGQAPCSVVRLAKTVKLPTNTRSVVRVKVDAADGTTGVFLPKQGGRRNLMIAPTVDTVRNGMVRVAVLNVEGRRENLPAREALGKWIPTDDEMEILSVNGELERARVAEWVATLRKDDAQPLRDEEKLDIGEMETADRDLVIALLRQYADIVEKKEGCPPLSKTGVVHHINTGNAAPIMLRRRRHAVAENAIIDKEVDEMLYNGVIEEGSGAWGFPVVLVKKKDGTVRFCIDYRALNSVTVKDVYPLPRVDETLEALHGAQRFTSLDLHAGYWQLGVAEEDKPKTAFTTRRGLFQFCRMPFGLCNAPSTFQRLMDCVLRGLTWICCLVYLDDVVIFTKGSVSRHVVELAVVLERLAEAGLSLKATKCSFATTTMEYLGHDLTPEGIKPTNRLIKAITDFPRPQDEAAVRRFVALAGYYRRFMPDFGSKMAPLTTLLRKSTEWSWGEPQEEAFTWAKAWLSQKPVLIYPDYRLPFKLTTDASKTGLGAVLSQDQGHGDQPVAYASKVNSPLVAKYNISELECLAVVWAVRLFRPHLYGRKFTIVTDHVALKWLMTAKEPAGRLHRWALTLQEYDFDILYRPGKENHVADALSRGPAAAVADAAETDAEAGSNLVIGAADDCNNDAGAAVRTAVGRKVIVTPREADRNVPQYADDVPKHPPQPMVLVDMVEIADAVAKQPYCETTACDIPDDANDSDRTPSAAEREIKRAAVAVIQAAVVRRVEPAEMGVVQFTDDDIRREQAKSVMVQMIKRQGSYRGRRVLVAEDGLVSIDNREGEKRVVLPVKYWALAFKEAHDSIWAGHLRGPQTLERLKRMYWWPHMKRSVRSWVAACQDCGSRKAKPQIVVPPLRSVRTGDVCDRWAVDVAGPLPVTAQGNRYVIAAVEYTTRYAVAEAVPEHTAKSIARFLMNKVILVFGPMREVMMDGAREFGSEMIAELLELMQTKQATPVPYRPKLLGLVERFHRTWKDIASLYVDDEQDDWDDFLPCALYAYNGSQHATHGFQPNELMMGRKLRTPAELLRRNNLRRPYRTLDDYHEVLMQDLRTARELAAIALQKEQARQAMYYNQRNVRQHAVFRPGQLVWVYRPARGPGITKFGHRWRGPAQILEAAGYDNYRIRMLESGHELVTHCSFLISFYYPTNLLEQMAKDIDFDLREEAIAAADIEPENDGNSPGIDGEVRTEIPAATATNSTTAAAATTMTGIEPTGELVAFAAVDNLQPRVAADPVAATSKAATTTAEEAAAVNVEAAAAETTAEVASAASGANDAVTREAAAAVSEAINAGPKRRRGRPRKRAVTAVPVAVADAAASAPPSVASQAVHDAAVASDAAAINIPAGAEIAATAGAADRNDANPGTQMPAERMLKRRRTGRTIAVPNDAISGRTRARIRHGPYPADTVNQRDERADSPVRSRAAADALTADITADTDAAARSGGESAETSQPSGSVGADAHQLPAAARHATAAAEEDARPERQQPEQQQPATAAEEDEARVYVFAGQGRRGVDSLVGPQPRLPRIPAGETVVERRRRRYRTRVGRYSMEFEVAWLDHRSDGTTRRPEQRLWINQRDYEQLWKEGRLRTSSDDPIEEDDEQQQHDEPTAIRVADAAATRLATADAARAAAPNATRRPADAAVPNQGPVRSTGRIGDDSYPRGRE